MYKNKRFFAVIPARGGSKSIPRKNIKLLCGKPLIAHTIEQAKASRYLDYFLVSTDDEEISSIASQFGADVPFVRPDELSDDKARGIDVAIHALKWAENNKGYFDYCLILQPTSPLRTSRDIDACIQIAGDTLADSVMSMYRLTDMSIRKLKKIDGDRILPLIQEEGKTTSARELLDPIYKRNCAVYLTKSDILLSGNLFGEDSRAYIMPDNRSPDINEPQDFDFVEFLMQKEKMFL